MTLKNVVEEYVEVRLAEILPQYKCCKCTKCRLDIMAISLNDLRPHYIVSSIGEALATHKYLTPQLQAEITAVVANAIGIVADNPRHSLD